MMPLLKTGSDQKMDLFSIDCEMMCRAKRIMLSE